MLKLRMEDCNSDLNGASRAKVDKEAGVGVERRAQQGRSACTPPPPQASSLVNEPQRGRGAMQPGAMETE